MSSAAYSRARRDAHREEETFYQAAYRAAHREERQAWRLAHREEQNAYHRAYYDGHREEMLASQAAYKAAHPEKVREHARRSSARRRGAMTCEHAGCLTLGPVQLAWQINQHACYLCGTPLWQGVNLTLDHVLPVALGGLHCADNLRPACLPCNRRKGARVLS
jgi:5-methylcytosine-specific restriction endonuclease McrA